MEFTRSRQAYLRLQDKYAKAVKDAESTIRQRSVSLEFEKKTLLGKEKEKTVKDSFSKVSRKCEVVFLALNHALFYVHCRRTQLRSSQLII